MTTETTAAGALLARRGPLPPEFVADIVAAVASQLDDWAADGLVYGTVQPDQITVLLDAESLVTAALSGFPSPAEILSPSLLMSNARFIAPEVLRGAAFESDADVWALACTAFAILTGTAPFAGGTVAKTMARASGEAVPATGLPGDVDVVLATALNPDPVDRYGSAREFAAALRRAARPQ